MLILFFFLVTLFFNSAVSNAQQPLLSACLTTEEKADLEYFFHLLMFENHGAFVLFGSKPLCEMHMKDTEDAKHDIAFQEWFNALPEEKRAQFKARMTNTAQKEAELQRNPYRGWLALKKALEPFEMKHFLFRMTPLRGSCYELMLINLQQCSRIVMQNDAIFKKASKMEFVPHQMMTELQNPNSLFWKNVFSHSNHLAKGLFFGFGLKNSIFGNLRLTYSNAKISSELKMNNVKHLKKGSFSHSCNCDSSFLKIPLFIAIEGDEMIKIYEKEKLEIEKLYQGQDLVEVTLQRLIT